jgi:hypothetical protein
MTGIAAYTSAATPASQFNFANAAKNLFDHTAT